MKLELILIICLILLLTTQVFMPWWTMVIPMFFLGKLVFRSNLLAFAYGFCIVFALWCVASFILDHQSNHRLSTYVSRLLFLPNSVILHVVTGIVGGIVGGVSSLLGSYFKNKING